jgi:hypothetical protein
MLLWLSSLAPLLGPSAHALPVLPNPCQDPATACHTDGMRKPRLSRVPFSWCRSAARTHRMSDDVHRHWRPSKLGRQVPCSRHPLDPTLTVSMPALTCLFTAQRFNRASFPFSVRCFRARAPAHAHCTQAQRTQHPQPPSTFATSAPGVAPPRMLGVPLG